MRVRLLGTGSADGWPNPWCGCASCATESAAGRRRGQTSVLVDDVVLLDCGPETPLAAGRQGVGLHGVREVLVTHAHPDHWAPSFLLYRSWVHGDRDAARHPLEVVGPADVVDQARQWVEPGSEVRFTAVRPGHRFALTHHDVVVHAAQHGVGTVLYDLTERSRGHRLLYATDTGPLTAETVREMAGAAYDLVLLEETFGDWSGHGTQHLDLATFGAQLRRLRDVGAVTDDSRVVPVHLSHRNPPTPELRRRLADWGAELLDDGAVVDLAPARRAPSRRAPSREGRSLEEQSRERQPRGAAPVDSPVTRRRTLVLGGARSGKSREAERILATAVEVEYAATGYVPDERVDPEWADRVAHHREARPATWRTTETLDLVDLLERDGPALLIDCLTLWVTRVMDAHDAWDDRVWDATAAREVGAEADRLVAAWRRTTRRVVMVSNEVGQGVVPASPGVRRFRDLMGRVNAAVAAETEDVRWCVAGRVVGIGGG